MSVDDKEELARELNEFGYRETDDPDEADRRNYYKVERWDAAEQHVFQLLHASNDLSRAHAVFTSETKRRPRGRYTLRQGSHWMLRPNSHYAIAGVRRIQRLPA
jgi:hypothetical protein